MKCGAHEPVLDFIGRSLDAGARFQSEGGVLLHGALAERQGRGVLLLGPSGRGKTTASGRLPPPWQSLSDDMSLVMPGRSGAWRAHPWPSWSSCLQGAAGSSGSARRAVPLGGLFFMTWAAADRAERVGPGRAACLLLESFEQAWLPGACVVADEAMKGVRARVFTNIASLAQDIPTFLLHMSPAGPFWDRVAGALNQTRPRAKGAS